MPDPSPAITEAESEKALPRWRPSKPWLVTWVQALVDQLAPPPSELVTPGVARATSSASRARASSASGVRSVAS
jgi:hypothetical protein